MPKGTHITTWNHRRKFVIQEMDGKIFLHVSFAFVQIFADVFNFGAAVKTSLVIVCWLLQSPPPPMIQGGHSNLASVVSTTKCLHCNPQRIVPCFFL